MPFTLVASRRSATLVESGQGAVWGGSAGDVIYRVESVRVDSELHVFGTGADTGHIPDAPNEGSAGAGFIEEELPENVIVLGHRWFDMNGRIDLGLLYNGTTAVELGAMGIPVILCGDFGPTDYSVGHAVPRDLGHYERLIRFEEKTEVAADLKERSAAWLKYLSSDEASVPYRYYARQVTNRVIYPTWWLKEDIERYLAEGDVHVERLASKITLGR